MACASSVSVRPSRSSRTTARASTEREARAASMSSATRLRRRSSSSSPRSGSCAVAGYVGAVVVGVRGGADGAPARAPVSVDVAVAENPKEPGAEVRAGRELGSRPKRAREGLLDEVLRVCVMARQVSSDAEERIQVLERGTRQRSHRRRGSLMRRHRVCEIADLRSASNERRPQARVSGRALLRQRVRQRSAAANRSTRRRATNWPAIDVATNTTS